MNIHILDKLIKYIDRRDDGCWKVASDGIKKELYDLVEQENRGEKIPKCRKCDVEMYMGKGIRIKGNDRNSEFFVWKCPECGHSFKKDED